MAQRSGGADTDVDTIRNGAGVDVGGGIVVEGTPTNDGGRFDEENDGPGITVDDTTRRRSSDGGAIFASWV